MKKYIFLIISLWAICISAQTIQTTGITTKAIIPETVEPKNISAKSDTIFPALVFQGADIRAIINFFAETGNVNLVLDPAVSGSVDLKLKKVSWATAFTSILNTYDLVVTKEGNTYRVQKLEDYRKSITDMREYEKRQKELLPRETKIITLNFADASAMSGVLAKVLTDRGELVVDPRTNSIIINDIPESFPKIDSLVAVLDIETPQIRISVKILNVDRDFIKELGVKWDMSAGGVIYSDGASQGRTGFIQPNNQYVGVGVSAQEIGVGDQIGRFTWGVVSGDYDIGVQIAALTSNNKGKILDNPEIVTLDNQLAELLAGVKIPINTVDEAGNVLTTFYDVGVRLSVKPHVTSAGRVAMEIYVERNSYQPTAAGYSIATRWARTNVLIDDGGALVIGGMTTEDTKKRVRGVPVLKDIPIIGRLFKYERDEKTESELVVFVTPYIIVDNKVSGK